MSNQSKQSRSLRRYQEFTEQLFPNSIGPYDFKNKEECVNQHVAYMLNRTQSMFRWSGLPDTIPARMLELYLQTNGNVCWYEHNGELYVFTGGLGGMPDPYYLPTIYTIANPALSLFVTAEIGKDCVVMPNDTLYMGLMPMFRRYATGMSETELSIKISTINTRIVNLMSASDDKTKESAELYLERVEAGELGVIAENAFLDGVKSQPYGSTGYSNQLTNLIELEQYWKASWFNDLGLNANYNMKRESLNSEESQLNNDALLPLVDNMLACRQEFVEHVNNMFDTNITVELASSWEDNQQEIDLEHDEMAADGGDSDGTRESDDGGSDSGLDDSGGIPEAE